ncbi:MAG: HAD-IA family hydrolase [Candidatus Woesearchaeota archaeon]
MKVSSYLKFWIKSYKSKEKVFTARYNSIYDIHYNHLLEQGVKLIIFDVDDTLTSHHGNLPLKTINLLKELSDNFKIAFLTNRTSKKRDKLNKLTDIIKIHIEQSSKKPSAKGYINVINRFNLKPSEVAMVGDRVGTDLWGAVNSKISHRILVKPYSKAFSGRKANIFVMLFRWLEKRYALA